jgi:hypothetical protein
MALDALSMLILWAAASCMLAGMCMIFAIRSQHHHEEKQVKARHHDSFRPLWFL